MAVIGATQLEPVNVLGQYVQGLEAGRQFKAQRAKEAQVTQLQNMLMGATPKQLQDPEFINRLAVTPEGATIAKTLSESVAAQRTARKDELTIAREQGELVAREAGAFLTNPSLLNKATIDTWAQGAVQRGILSPEAYTRFQELSDDPAVLGPAMQRLQTQGMSLADQLKYQRPQGSTQDVGGVVVTIDPFTGKEIGRVDLSAKEIAARTAGRPLTQIDARTVPEKAYGAVVGDFGGKRDIAAYNAAASASEALNKAYETQTLLASGQPQTGAFAELTNNVNRVKQVVTGRKDKSVSDTEVLDALLGSEVFSQIQALGIGARGLDTLAEREYLRKVIAGTITLDSDTLKRMTDMRVNVMERAIKLYNRRVESGELDRFFRDSGVPKQPIPMPERPTTAPAGTTRKTKKGTDYSIE